MRKWFVGILAVFLVVPMALAIPIADIQTVENPAEDDASPLVDQEVTVTGWITFEPQSYGGNRFFMADAPGPWNGIYVYVSGADLNYGFGWQVEVTGTVAEYFGFTEIEVESEDDITVISDEVDWEGDLPAAVAYTVVDASMLGAEDPANAEQYESVLVQVEDVATSNVDGGFGEWWVADAEDNAVKIDNPASDDFGYVHRVEADKPYTYVRGPLNYSFSEYKILPEIAYDLRVAEDVDNGWYTPIAYFQQVRPMDMTIQEDDQGELYTNDWSYAALQRYDNSLSTSENEDYQYLVDNSQIVTIKGIVTMPTGLSYAGEGIKVILCDTESGEVTEPYSAILSYNADSTAYPAMYEGDEIVMTGFIAEYETAAAKMTELFITAPITLVSAGNELPVPATVTVPEMRNPMYAERWGNAYVKMFDVIVANNEYQYEPMSVSNSPDTPMFNVKIDDDSNWSRDTAESPAYQAWQDYIVPPVNSVIDSLTGWVYHHFGTYDTETDDWVYKVCPDYPADIVIGEGPPTIISVTRDIATPVADEEVTVTANVTDNNEVSTVNLMYKIGDDGEFQTVAMTHDEGLVWTGAIPGQADGSLVWYYVEATDDIDQTSTLPSNIEANLFGYWAQEDLGIYQVQYTPFSGGSSPYADMLVSVSGTVVSTYPNAHRYVSNSGSDHADPMYVLQTGDQAAFNGIMVHIPDELTPDAAGFQSGDNITVTGRVDESGVPDWDYKYGGNTRIVEVVDASLNSSHNEYIAHSVSLADLQDDVVEPLESAFVELTNVTISEAGSYDWTIVDGDGNEFLLDDDMVHTGTDATGDETIDETVTAWFAALAADDVIPSVTGIITYSFGSWKIEVRGWMDITSVSTPEDNSVQPLEFTLNPVYPNPFNPSTTVSYTIPNTSDVKLTVFNSLGQRVVNLIDGQVKAGSHTAFWNGKNANGMPVTSGIYFLRLQSEGRMQVQKMVLMK
ncbi:T9SS type A sorting domain-containing protein [bacterium]|nr:T9SS type A sorting domain-containing protein [bacterium]